MLGFEFGSVPVRVWQQQRKEPYYSAIPLRQINNFHLFVNSINSCSGCYMEATLDFAKYFINAYKVRHSVLFFSVIVSIVVSKLPEPYVF